MADDLRTLRLLRRALAAIWTALEHDPDTDTDAVWQAQTIADEGLALSVQYCKPGKDLTDDTIGLESWRRCVTPGGEVIREP